MMGRRAGLRGGGQRGQLLPPVMKLIYQIKYSFEKFLCFRSDTRMQLCIIFLCCVEYQGPQQQLISLQIRLSVSFSYCY